MESLPIEKNKEENSKSNGFPMKVKVLAIIYLILIEKTYSRESMGAVLNELILVLWMMQKQEVIGWLPEPCKAALKLFDDCLYRIKMEKGPMQIIHVRKSGFHFKNFYKSEEFRKAEIAGKILLDDDLIESEEDASKDPFDI